MPLLTATSEFGLGRTDAGVLIDSVIYTVSAPFHAVGRYKLSRIRRRVQSVGCGCRAGKRANPIRRFGGDLPPVRAEVLLCRCHKLQQLSADTTAVKPAHLSSFLASFFFFSSAAVFNQTRVNIRLLRRKSSRRSSEPRYTLIHVILGQLSLASLRGRLIEYQLRLG